MEINLPASAKLVPGLEQTSILNLGYYLLLTYYHTHFFELKL